MSLPLVVLTPFLGAILAAWVSRLGRLHAAWMAGAITLLALAWLLPLADAPFAGQTVIQRFSWMPAAGLDLAFRLDGLGLLFALMILGIGLLIILYARYYLSPSRTAWAASTPSAALHGLHAGRRPVGEHHPTADLLGADQPVVLSADQLLAAARGCPQRRAHGADRHRRRGAGPARRLSAARADRRQLRPVRDPGLGRPHPRPSALCCRCWC